MLSLHRLLGLVALNTCVVVAVVGCANFSGDDDAASESELNGNAARAGVRDGSTLVVYDDTLSMYAARAWWSLRAYGIDAVRILDGGFPAWVGEGRPTSSGTWIRRILHSTMPNARHDIVAANQSGK